MEYNESFKTDAVILNVYIYYNIALATLIPCVAPYQQNFRKNSKLFCCCSQCLLITPPFISRRELTLRAECSGCKRQLIRNLQVASVPADPSTLQLLMSIPLPTREDLLCDCSRNCLMITELQLGDPVEEEQISRTH